MSNTPITPKQFLSQLSALELDVHSTRKFTSKQATVYYIPIRCNKRPLSVLFRSQVLAASAKAPSDEMPVKFLNVAFKTLDYNEIPYSPAEPLIESNADFITFLEKLELQYRGLAAGLKDITTDKFKLPAQCKVNTFSQTTRLQDGEEVELEHPIYRMRLPVAHDRCGTMYKEAFTSNVHNARTKQEITLTVEEAKKFITYQSLVTGILNVECIVISKTGISLRLTIKQLHVLHKPQEKFELETSDMDSYAVDEPASLEHIIVPRVSKKPSKWHYTPGSAAEKPPRDTDSEDQSESE